MDTKRSGAQPSQKAPAEHFTGTVRIDPLFQSSAPGRAGGAYVTFEPCARSDWHTHPLGQLGQRPPDKDRAPLRGRHVRNPAIRSVPGTVDRYRFGINTAVELATRAPHTEHDAAPELYNTPQSGHGVRLASGVRRLAGDAKHRTILVPMAVVKFSSTDTRSPLHVGAPLRNNEAERSPRNASYRPSTLVEAATAPRVSHG